MFDMRKTGKKIAELRKENNFTQSELADKLGISYQAVSNWERGDSMPDISKLEELSLIFNVTIDELLENRRVAQLAKEISEEKDIKESVSKDDLSDALFLQKPKVVDEFVSNYKTKTDEEKQNINDSDEFLIAMAPFVSEDALEDLIDEKGFENISSKTITALAPFLSEEYIGKLVLSNSSVSQDEIVALAPFMDEEDIGRIVLEKIDNGEEISNLIGLAPFMDEDMLSDAVINLIDKGKKIDDCMGLVPFLSDEAVDAIAGTLSDDERVSLMPFLSEEKIAGIAKELYDKGDLDKFKKIIHFVDEDLLVSIIKKNKK